jgi:hypothetical protein
VRCDDGIRDNLRVVVNPDRVADWALLSWTPMTLTRGIPDRVVVPATTTTNTTTFIMVATGAS